MIGGGGEGEGGVKDTSWFIHLYHGQDGHARTIGNF